MQKHFHPFFKNRLPSMSRSPLRRRRLNVGRRIQLFIKRRKRGIAHFFKDLYLAPAPLNLQLHGLGERSTALMSEWVPRPLFFRPDALPKVTWDQLVLLNNGSYGLQYVAGIDPYRAPDDTTPPLVSVFDRFLKFGTRPDQPAYPPQRPDEPENSTRTDEPGQG